jgi:hypothetical protein
MFGYSVRGVIVDRPCCVACRKSDARTFIDCFDYHWCSVPSLYESDKRYSVGYHSAMCVSYRMAISHFTQLMLKLLPGANDTANPPTITCSIEEICAFGGFDGKDPNQSFRYLDSTRRNWAWVSDHLF